MPVLDHFRAPLKGRRAWESFHASWAVYLRDALTPQLPEDYYVEVQTHHGPVVEIDGATSEEEQSQGPARGASMATLTPQVWTPSVPPLTMPAVFPGAYEVRVINTRAGPQLVGAIELVSPRNKDRPQSRRAFAAKCVHYLAEGIGLIVVDIVTRRTANLHNLTMRLIGQHNSYQMSAESPLYPVAYRPIQRGRKEIDLWPVRLNVGDALPTLPLSPHADLCVPVDLEAAYGEACHKGKVI